MLRRPTSFALKTSFFGRSRSQEDFERVSSAEFPCFSEWGGLKGADDAGFVRREMSWATASGGLRDQSLKNPLLLPPEKEKGAERSYSFTVTAEPSERWRVNVVSAAEADASTAVT